MPGGSATKILKKVGAENPAPASARVSILATDPEDSTAAAIIAQLNEAIASGAISVIVTVDGKITESKVDVDPNVFGQSILERMPKELCLQIAKLLTNEELLAVVQCSKQMYGFAVALQTQKSPLLRSLGRIKADDTGDDRYAALLEHMESKRKPIVGVDAGLPALELSSKINQQADKLHALVSSAIGSKLQITDGNWTKKDMLAILCLVRVLFRPDDTVEVATEEGTNSATFSLSHDGHFVFSFGMHLQRSTVQFHQFADGHVEVCIRTPEIRACLRITSTANPLTENPTFEKAAKLGDAVNQVINWMETSNEVHGISGEMVPIFGDSTGTFVKDVRNSARLSLKWRTTTPNVPPMQNSFVQALVVAMLDVGNPFRPIHKKGLWFLNREPSVFGGGEAYDKIVFDASFVDRSIVSC